MTHTPDVLLVAPDPLVAAHTLSQLTDAGLRVTVVETFAAAREQLQSRPDLLISEVRLGEYNGLHLALRARSSGIPAIVLGQEDTVTAREAEKLGAVYIAADADRRGLTTAIRAAGVRVPARFGRRTHAA
jgi:DNA-binding response OmpR family regulator